MTTILAALSTVAVGLMSGLYWAFTVAVMPGLRDADDRAFVTSMQAINRRILNPWFLTVFMGSLLLPIATAVALVFDDDGDARWWGIAGAVAAAVPFAITMRGNVPLNDALDGARPDHDPAAKRRAFEGPWTRLNLWRATTSTLALAALIRTLLMR
jgi:uncharacterized membrane protein